jgi:NDP-sugar pyrophosphorylase family protein
MLSYPLFYLETLGLQNLVVNTHHRPESVRSALRGAIGKADYSLEMTYEAPEILGSGGGLKNAHEFFSDCDAIICANGDAVAIFPDQQILQKIVQSHLAKSCLATLVLCPHPEAGRTISAAWMNERNQIQGFGLTPPAQQCKPWHYTGYIVLSPKILDYLPLGESNLLHDGLMTAWADSQRVEGVVIDPLLWFETGDEAHYLGAHRELLDLLANPSAVGGATLRTILDRFSPGWGAVQPRPGVFLHRDSHINRGQLAPRTFIGANCVIHPEAQLSKSGFVVLGEQCEVREPCLLEDVVLITGAVTQARGFLSQCIVSTLAM